MIDSEEDVKPKAIADRPVVVGIGASAGGLEAISRLLKGIPEDSGMSFVIVQHLDPTHKSALVEILSRRTPLQIQEVENGTRIEANHVYVIPPGQYLSIKSCVLELSEPQDPRGSRMAIDYFLTSLAEDACEFGIGVVLSGTGNDGTAGLQEIKQYGGLTVVQDPEEAEHAGMPQHAIDAVRVDYVMAAELIGSQLKRYVAFCRAHGPLSAQSIAQAEQSDLTPILDLMRKKVNHDFRRYRKNTLTRRIRRRMGLHQLDQLSDYLALLSDNSTERDALRCDFLIGVTRFFRNPDAWKVLEKKVVRPWFESPQESPLRVWCAGCATGEEAYSIAMVLLEQTDIQQRKSPFQIFATDVAEDAIVFAREGVYPEAIMKDVPLERLRRFFKKEPGGYRVSKQLRESVVFANQNVLAQPPFAKLDLILCRNLLIYLQREAQDRVMSVFQFALKDGGVLFQGSSESVGEATELYTPISKKHRIYRRNELKAWPPAGGDYAANIQPLPEFTARQRAARRDEHNAGGIATSVQRQLLQQLGHGVVVVNQNNRVLFADGDADSFLQFSMGELTAELPDVMEIARKGLKAKVRSALRKIWNGQSTLTTDARVNRDGNFHPCEIRISKMRGRPENDPAAMIVFTPTKKSQKNKSSLIISTMTDQATQTAAQTSTIAAEETLMELEHELTITREQLNSSISEFESANEELKAANEEAMTMNEELQSSNEELETSKEELQSLNEELTTLNNQLEIKVNELEDTTNDLENLLTSSDIPTVFLDTHFRIRRYTPSCSELFRFIAGDIGRPLADITAYFEDPDLLDDAKAVLRDLQPREKQVASTDAKRRYRRRMLPYRTDDNRIQGVVVTLTNVTDLLAAQEQAQHQLAENQSIYAATPVGLAFLDTQLRFLSINERLAEIDGCSVEDHLGKTISEVLPTELAETVVKYYQQVVESGEAVRDLEVKGKMAKADHDGIYLASHVPVFNDANELLGISSVVQDITQRKEREQHLKFMADVHAEFGPLDSSEEIMQIGSRRIFEHLGLNRCAIAEHSADGKEANVISEVVAEGLPSSRGNRPTRESLTPEEFKQLTDGQLVTIENAQDKSRGKADRERSDRLGIGACVKAPFPAERRLKFSMTACRPTTHHWTEIERNLIRDLTSVLFLRVDRARATEELAASRQQLETAMDAARMGSFWWEPESDKAKWDDQWYDAIGVSRDFERTGEAFFKLVHPDDIVVLNEAVRIAFEDGEKYQSEFRVRSQNGEYRWVAGNGRVTTGENGQTRLVGLNWDITNQKLASEQIRLGEQRLRSAAEAAGFGMLHADMSTGLTTYSPELLHVVGLPDDAPRTTANGELPDWVHPDDQQLFNNLYTEFIKQKTDDSKSINHRFIRPDGEVRWLHLLAKPVFSGKGKRRKLKQVIGTIIDITDRRNFEESLDEARRAAETANESKSAFLANMSHEIRTPMTAILGYADLMTKVVEDPEAIGHLRTIRRNGDFLLGIINDILDLSKIEAGRLDIVRDYFDPACLVEEVRSIMDVRAAESNLELTVIYEGKIPTEIESDPKCLRQILINLVGNAIKFTNEGGVKMIVSLKTDQLHFIITDTGIGMTPNQQNRLFQPFSQGDHTVNREYGGSGLGLAISQRLAAMLGGEIVVESVLGKGSSFAFAIEVGDISNIQLLHPQILNQSEIVDVDPDNIQLNCHALIVDDRRDIRYLTKNILSSAGATIVEASDGQQAIDAFYASKSDGTDFDIIILDMQMPRMDGYEAAQALRRLGFTKPIIALTADAMQGDMKRCIECGCNDYLSKPIDKNALQKMVHRYVSKK